MLVIPSLDLTPSQGVTPSTGAGNAASIMELLQHWERAGFRRVHLVSEAPDRGFAMNRPLEEILRDAPLPTQVAARADHGEDIETLTGMGADLVVLGPRAIDDPDWLASVATRYPDQLLVSTPARERRTRSRGAVRTLPLDLRDLAASIAELPLAGLVVEFAADASIGHSDLALLEDVVEDLDLPVLVAGLVPSLGVLRDLEFRGTGGVIVAAEHLSDAFDGQMLARNFAD